MARTWHRWLPAGAVVALIAGTVTLTSQAGAVDLPDKSPEDVLAMLIEQDVEAFSGTFETTSELGLPMPTDIDLGPGGPDLEDAELGMPDGARPGGGDGESGASGEDGDGAGDVLAALELLTGDNTGRVFVDGPGAARFQHIDGLDERNVVVNGSDVWFYDSATNEATHLVLPDEDELAAAYGHVPGDLAKDSEWTGRTGQTDSAMPGDLAPHNGTLPPPEELAAAAVAALEPSTELSVGQHERVAGRDAYTLRLTPRAAETLVAAVTITVDGETGFPLGVTVTARGQEAPALHAAYTDIDFTAPDASLFDFAPPAGATVEEETIELPALDATPRRDSLQDVPGPQGEVLGEGWGAVVVLPAGDAALADEPLLDQLTEPVDGGRLLSTALVNVLLTDDGRMLAGAVTAEHLQALAAQ